jgi:hypothetical protein
VRLTDADIEAIEGRVQKATPGPLLQRDDEDYYQGGRYIGRDPYHYGLHGAVVEGVDPTSPMDCYFHTDVARIHNADDEALLLHASEDVSALVRDLKEAREALNQIAGMIDKTLLGPSRQDYVERQTISERQAHEIELLVNTIEAVKS